MTFTQTWIASGIVVFAALGIAPLVLGTWVMVQRTGGVLSGLWFGFLLTALVGALAVGALGLYGLATTSVGSVLGG